MEEPPNDRTIDHNLQAVIPRLVDLQRKCRSLGSRNDEADEMEARIESILQRLQGKEEDDAEPPSYGALARELYAVERFFESNGFLSIAKEVAHVERTLEALAPPDEPEQIGAQGRSSVDTPVEKPAPMVGETEDETLPETSKWAVPRPLAAVVAFAVVAIIVCVVLIVRHERSTPLDTRRPTMAPTPVPTTPPPTPTPIPTRSDPTPAPGAILAEEVGRARLALAEGDVDKAIEHLSQAALIDSDHATVLGTASHIVGLLVDRADTAADQGLWEIADLTLVRAGRIATRFGLDTDRIERAAHRYSQMDRFTLIKPTDASAIRAAAGRRVTVFLKDGTNQESIINTIEGGELLLDEDTTVRGGAMYYVERIPLAEIDYLKVWEK